MKRIERRVISFLAVIAMLAATLSSSAGVVTNRWTFTSPSEYSYDSTKIEVTNGLARLVLQPQKNAVTVLADYLTNGMQSSGVAYGCNASMMLTKSGPSYNSAGTYISGVLDGGSGVPWRKIIPKASNLKLDTRLEIPSGVAGLLQLYHFNNNWANALGGAANPVGSPGFTTSSKCGTAAAVFNGNNYAELPNATLLDGKTACTIICWLKLNAYTSYGGLVTSYNTDYFDSLNQLGTSGRLSSYFYTGEPVWPYSYVASSTALTQGQWYFVAVTVQVGAPIRMYVNGVVDAVGNVTTGPIRQSVPFNVAFDSYEVFRKSNCHIDELAILDRALSPVEIYSYYEMSPLRFQLRSSNTDTNLTESFVGSDGSSNTFYSPYNNICTSGGSFNTSDRYAQIKTYFTPSYDLADTPYLEAIGLAQDYAAVFENTIGDFAKGAKSGITNIPARSDTSWIGLEKKVNGGFPTNGVYTSPVIDAGGVVQWDTLAWQVCPERSSSTSGMLGMWHLNGDWSDVFLAHNGTPLGLETYTTLAKLGERSAVFDGSSSHATISGLTACQSAEFWIRTDNPVDGVLTLGSGMYVAISNRVIVTAGFVAPGPAVYVNGRRGAALVPGWNHVALVLPSGSFTSLDVGVAAADYFQGQMDELSVYNRALTEAEIAAHYVSERRTVAGYVRAQVRAGSSSPPSSGFLGPDGTSNTFYVVPAGNSLTALGANRNARYFQYVLNLDGDGTATPAVDSVTIGRTPGPSVSHSNAVDFIGGTFNAATTRWVGDDAALPEIYSAGPVNLAADASVAGLWHMEETAWSAAGSVIDSSYNSINGTPENAPSPIQGGIAGVRCGSFNGANDVTIPLLSTPLGSADFSVGAWFNTTSTVSRSALVSTFNTTSNTAYWAIEFNGDGGGVRTGALAFVLGDGTSVKAAVLTQRNVADGTWHHAMGVRNGRQAALYVDGKRVSAVDLGASFGSVGNSSIKIAKHGTQSLYYSGLIDEVVIYRRAFTDSEIGSMAAAGFDTKATGVVTGPVLDANSIAFWQTLTWGAEAPYSHPLDGTADPNLVGLWHMDAITNNKVMDEGYTGGHDAAVVNGVALDASGRFGSAASFGGSSDQALRVTNDLVALSSIPLCVEAWINPADNISRVVVDKMAGSTGYRLGLDGSGKPYFRVNNSACSNVVPVRLAQWTHMAGVYDGQTARLYVNGSLVAGVSESGTITAPTANLFIGLVSDNSGDFYGKIDEVAIHDRALNGEEILDHYRSGAITLKLQARSWTPPATPGVFIGPDKTTNTFFTKASGSTLLGIIPDNRRFQWQATLATEDAAWSPRLQGTRVDVSFYPVDSPFIEPGMGNGTNFLGKLLSFGDTLSTNNQGVVRYLVSGSDGAYWYYWDGSQWVQSAGVSGFAQSTAQIQSGISNFYDQVYAKTGGIFKFRAFLDSDGHQRTELDEVRLGKSPGRIVVLSPNGQETGSKAWVVGVPYSIQWSSTGVVTSTNIVIDLYDQGGSNKVKTIVSGVTNSGSYFGVVHNAIGSYRIKVRDGSDPTIEDLSDYPFELVDNLHLSRPDGGEFWYLGRTNTLVWESPPTYGGDGVFASFWFSNDGGTNWERVIAARPNPIGTNSYGWVTPDHDPFLPSENAKMAVSTPDDPPPSSPTETFNYDISDNSFVMAGIVVTYPAAGTGVKLGTVTNVEWVSAAAGPSVSIDLFDGTAWTNLAASAPNSTGSNSVPCLFAAKTPTEAALIRVTSLSNAAIAGVSYPFVLADVQVLSPKSGDQWQIGTTNVIAWMSAGAGDVVDIAYSTDGNVWSNLVTEYTNINSSQGSFVTNYAPAWVIPGPPSTSVVVKVTATQKQGLSAQSGTFNFSGVRVVSPNGGEVWEFTGTNEVRWLAVDAGVPATIDLAYQDGVTTGDYQNAASATLYLGRQTIPPAKLARPTTLGRARLTATAPTVTNLPFPMTDISDKSFTIRGMLMVTPTTNLVYTMGTTVTDGLQWYSAATEDNSADLYYSRDGTNFTDTILLNAFNNNDGTSFNSRDWTVSRSLMPSTNARVRVAAGAYTSVSRPFVLRGIRLTQPSAGQVYDLGSRQTNRWTYAGFYGQISIAYASNTVSVNGMAGPFVGGGLSTNAYIPTGSEQWTVDPNLDPTTNAVVRMVVTRPTNDTDLVAYSDPFVLRGAKILAPSAGTNWVIGSSQTVVFVAAGMNPGARADFYYSADGIAYDVANPVAASIQVNSGINSFGWNIENSSSLSRKPSTNATIMLVSGSFTNISKAFTMRGLKIVAPTKTDILAVSDLTNTIRWVAVGTAGPFTLSYTVHDSPERSGLITNGIGGTSFDWALTSDVVGSNVTLTITDGVFTNESEAFSVVPAPSVKIVSPAVGEFWKVTETNNVIRWAWGGKMTNDFTVAWSPYPYSNTNVIPGGVGPMALDPDNGTYYCSWPVIPDALGDVRIIVVNNDNPIIQDTLSGFKIAPKFEIDPLIGDLYALDQKAVNWVTRGSVSGVKFFYSVDPFRATNSWVSASGSLQGGVGHNQASTFIWTLPPERTNTLWFRIQDDTYGGMRFDASKKGPYDDIGMYEVKYYHIVWHILDAATTQHLDLVSVNDSSGWSGSGLTSPVANDYPYGIWNTVWYRQYFNDQIVFNWSSRPSRTNVIYLTRAESAPEYHVMANFGYDVSGGVFRASAWLERSSRIITDPTACKIYVYDPEGHQTAAIPASGPQSNGVFWAELPPQVGRGRPYFAKVDIESSGNTYSSGVAFQLLVPSEQLVMGVVEQGVSNILVNVGQVDTKVTDLSTAQAAFRTTVTNQLQNLSNVTSQIGVDVGAVRTNLAGFSSNALTQLGMLTNTIGVIGPTGTNLVTQLQNLAESTLQRTSRLLSRPTTVKQGGTLDVLYRCRPSLTVNMTCSNMTLGVFGWSGTMIERAGGVYERAVTASYGLGDYLVSVWDSGGGLDQMIVKVTAAEIDDLAGSFTGISNQLARIEGSVTNLSTSMSNVQNSVTSMSTNLASMITQVGNVYKVVTNLQTTVNWTNVTDILALTKGITNTLGGMAPALYSLTGMPDQVSSLANSIGSLTNLSDQVAILTQAVSSVTSLTNIGEQVAFLTNLTPQMSYLTNLLTQIAPVTNMAPQVASLTNQMALLTNLPAQVTLIGNQAVYLTNLLTRMSGLTNQVAMLTNLMPQVAYLTNSTATLLTLTNLMPQVASLTNLPGQISALMSGVGVLTNLDAQMATLTSAVASVSTLTNIGEQVAFLTNLNSQVASLTNLPTQMALLTNMPGQVASLTNLPAQVGLLTNLPSQMASLTNLPAQTMYLTNLLTRMSGLTNLMPQMAMLTNLPAQVGMLTNLPAQMAMLTNLPLQVSYLTNVIDQVISLTGMAGQVSILTGAVASVSGLTNIGEQVAFLTNLNSQVASLTNLPAQMALLTNMPGQVASLTNLPDQVGWLTNLPSQMASLTNLPAQTMYLTNLLTRMSGLTNLPTQVAMLTNLSAQVGLLTNLPAQMATLTNLPLQVSYLTNVIDKVSSLTSMADQVSILTGAVAQVTDLTNTIGQITVLTNLTPQINYLTNQVTFLTNLVTKIGAVTNLMPQVAALTNQTVYLTNLLTRMSGLTNQVAWLTNSTTYLLALTNLPAQMAPLTNLPGQVGYLTNAMAGMGGITNIGPQVDAMTNSIAQIARLTNMPDQVNYLTNVISQLTGITNIADQVGAMTNAIGKLAGMTNIPEQVAYLTNVIGTLSGITNIGAQVADMTNSVGKLAGMTNIPEQVAYLTNVIGQVSQVTNIAPQVAQLTNALAQISVLTNLSEQMFFVTNALTQMAGLTNVPLQIANMTDAIAQLGGLTNVPDQVSHLTNAMAALQGLTNLTEQVGAMTSTVGQVALLTNMPAQVEYLTNLMAQVSSVTNIASQVAAMTNAVGKLAGMTNIPDQVTYLTNAMAALQGLTNLTEQVGAMTSTVSQVALLTNMPTQVSNLTNAMAALQGLTNLTAQVGAMTGVVSQVALLTNMPAQVSNLTNLMAQVSAVTNIGPQIAALSGLTNLSSQVALLTNIPTQIAYLTNSMSVLNGMTNLSAQVQALTNSIGQITSLTNLSGQVSTLTNLPGLVSTLTNVPLLVASLTNMPDQLSYLTNAIAVVGSLTNLGTQVAILTNSVGQITALTNMSGQMSAIDANVAALAATVATSNLVSGLELRVGQEGDPATSDTVFGRLASILQNLETVGATANTAVKRAMSAKTEASTAATGLQNVKRELGQGRVSQIASDLNQVQQSLQKMAGLIKEVPEGTDAKGLADALRDTVKKIDDMAKSRGVQLGLPETPSGGALTTENLTKFMDEIAKTKAMMDAVRLLMEEAAYKPVVVEWLESGQ